MHRNPQAYAHATVPFKGGIRRDIDTFVPSEGFWTLTGCHTNDLDALTKLTGYQVEYDMAGSIQGLYQARLGTVTYRFAWEGGRVQWLTGASPSQVASGLASTPLIAGRPIQSQFYFCNGVDENKKLVILTGTPVMRRAGLVAPTAMLTSAQGAAGAITGTYSYKYTYYNNVQGIESDPSPASNGITVTSKQIDLSAMQVSSDPQVDKKRLYRTTNGGGVWQLLTSINNSATTYTDNAIDSTLGAQVREDNGPPPLTKYLEVYNGMVVLAGMASPFQSTVALSAVLRPESFDIDNQYDLDPEEADVITGVAKYGRYVAVGKRYGLYLGEGADPEFMSFTRTRVTQGPISNWSIVPYTSALFYAGERGFYAFQGLQEEYISRPIEAVYRTLQFDKLANCTGFYYPHLNILVWNVASAGAASPDLYMIYNAVLKEWTTREVDATWVSSYVDTANRLKWWVGTSTGISGVGDTGYNDGGAAITMEVVTRGLSLGKSIDLLKNFRHVHINYEPNAGAVAATVSYSVDSPNGPFTAIGTFTPATGFDAAFNFNAVGRLVFIKITVTSGEAFVLRNIEVHGKILGRQRGWQ